MKADLHFHTTLSDGRDSPDQVLQNLSQAGVEFAALTDHDAISNGFADELKIRGIDSIPASEISTQFHGEKKVPLHMTAYAREFNPAARAMLERTRTGKTEKIRQQVAKLIEQRYPISYEGLVQWAQAKGYSPTGLNNAHLSSYIYSIPACIEKGNIDQQRRKSAPDRTGFLRECLSREGRNPIGAVEIPEYEPTTEKASGVMKNTGGIIAIAHPNFSWERYGGIAGLERDIAQLVEQGVMGIELNALATPEWARVILEIRKRYNLLLTFGSDNHGEKTPSKKHGLLGQLNPYFLEDDTRVGYHLKRMKKVLGV